VVKVNKTYSEGVHMYDMKVYGGVKIHLHAFLSAALDASERSGSRSG
jgi:hypothetical protein